MNKDGIINFVDINECKSNVNGCSHGCENTVGSYKCFCPPQLFLGPNGHNCYGKSVDLIYQDQSKI